MFTNEEIWQCAKKLNINFEQFTFDDFKRGIEIELEHGLIDPFTNVTNNNLEMTAKIALAHLKEFPNYYNEEYGLPYLEKKLKENV